MDSQRLWLLATIICLSSCLPEAQAQTCGDIGNVAQEFTESRERNFFLNIQDPAACDGTVTEFQYCYYRTDQLSVGHLFTFAVYRETSEGSNTYTPVSDAFNTGTGFFSHGSDSFTCLTYNPGLAIVIQAGDMIGACVYDPPNEGGLLGSRVQLDVVGQDAGVDRFLMKAVDNTGCGNTAVPDSVNGLTRADALVLHIKAIIVPNPTTAPPPLVTSVTTATSTPAVADVVSTPAVASSTAVSSTIGAFPSTAVSLSATSTRSLASTAVLEASVSSVIVRSTTSTITTSKLMIPILTATALSATTVIISTTAIDLMTTSSILTDPPGTSSSSPLPTTVVMKPSSAIVSTISSTPTLATATTTTELSTNFLANTPVPSTSSQIEVSTSTFTLSSSGATDVLNAIQPSATPIHSPITGTDTGTMETTAPTTEASTGGMSVTIIAVVVVIVILVVAVAIAIIIFCLRKKDKKKQVLQLGYTNATYTGHGDSVRERVRINDVYSDIGGTDLEHTYASGTYSLATDPYDFPKAVSNEKPLFDSAYAECGPYDEVRATFTPCKNSIKFSELLDEDERRHIYDELSPYQVPASEENDIYGQLRLWGTKSIHRQEIQVVGHLGSGQYGSVDRGLWNAKDNEPVDVALKSLTKTSEEDRVKFLQEAAIMAQFRHSNVILLHGIVIESPTLIVAEIAANGDLRSFLHTLRDKTERPGLAKLLLKCSHQVALGMEYLSTKGFVHRDLAARNVLVTQDYTCKIADFGMSRDLADENYYVSQGKDKIPVKWTAPEAIHYKKYSTASDVWAYGCLLYEIWSLGHKPFEGVTNQETIRLIDRGKRLSPPPGCPRRIYELMINCWHPQTMVRPTFQILALTYSGNERTLLPIPEEDSSTHPLAGVLGAPLEAGENMYHQLQNRYRNYDNKAVAETDDDYFTPTTNIS